jgi:hypothetical protein
VAAAGGAPRSGGVRAGAVAVKGERRA